MIQTVYDLSDLEVTKYTGVKTYCEEVAQIVCLTSEKKYDEASKRIIHTQDLCKRLKEKAVKANDEKLANILFLLDKYVSLLSSISSFWQLCDRRDYPTAWNYLQDGLDVIRLLEKFVSNDERLPVSISELSRYLRNVEKIYPYRVFMSTGTLNKKEVCSICKRSPFDQSCVHITGNLYMGEMAYTMVEVEEILEVSVVFNPADKRCVVFLDYDKENIENSQFGAIHTLITKLEEPYRFFDLKVKKITHPSRTTEG